MTRHEIRVKELKALLAKLQDEDVLVPNPVFNLTIVRGGDYVGFVNLRKDEQKIELLK